MWVLARLGKLIPMTLFRHHMNRLQTFPSISLGLKCFSLALTALLLLGCETMPESALRSIEMQKQFTQLAAFGKCQSAVATYDAWRKEVPSAIGPSDLANIMLPSNYARSNLANCLIGAGRSAEVVLHFEAACVAERSSLNNLRLQEVMCSPDRMNAVNAAYARLGRGNPWRADRQDSIKQMIALQERVDRSLAEIQARADSAAPGAFSLPSAQTSFLAKKRDAASESIRLLDREIAACQASKLPGCFDLLNERRRAMVDSQGNYQRLVAQSREVEAISDQSLRAIASVGAVSPPPGLSGQGNSATASASNISDEICPIGQPERSQCESRNAARRASRSGVDARARQAQSVSAAANPPMAGAVTAASRDIPPVYTNDPNPTNACVELRGNRIGNKCNYPLLVAWCVTEPQQTRNFFDNSAAFECTKSGGLNNIAARGAEGNVLYGYIHFYACPYNDYYTPARMKSKFFPEGQGLYRGTCGDGDRLTNHWTVGGTLVSRPRQ